MSALDRLWRVSSFRSALAQFAQLPPDRQVFVMAFADSMAIVPEGNPLSDEELSLTAVADVLWRVARDEGKQALLDGVHDLPISSDALLATLDELVPADSVSASDRMLRAAQGSVMPTVESAELTLDYRVLDSNDKSPRLAPVTLLRVELDEPVGGSGALVVQIPDALLSALEQQIEILHTLRRQISGELGADVVVETESRGWR